MIWGFPWLKTTSPTSHNTFFFAYFVDAGLIENRSRPSSDKKTVFKSRQLDQSLFFPFKIFKDNYAFHLRRSIEMLKS